VSAEFASVLDASSGSENDLPSQVRAIIADFESRISDIRHIAKSHKNTSEEQLRHCIEKLSLVQEGIKTLPDELALARIAASKEEAGADTDFGLELADSMTNVLREPRYLSETVSEVARISMAKNEFEALQIILVPMDDDIKGATWTVTDLRNEKGECIPSSDISIQVMGYMKSRRPAVTSNAEWWPVPILDFMKSVNVARGEVQPLWFCVRTRENTKSGSYAGTLQVAAEGCEPKKMKIEIEVWDFAVPKEQHLLTVWGNNEPTFEKVYGERYNKDMARRMFDFLIEHRLAVTTLYAQQAAGEPKSEAYIGYSHLSDPAELKRLWEAGSRWWNLGYLHPVFAQRAGKSMDEYVPAFMEMIKESLRVADAADWPRSNMMIYFFDETNDFEQLDRAAAKVKKAFPDIPLMTTAYDRSYGVKNGPIDNSIDIWCPLTPRYVEDWELIKEGRKLGKKVWWYVCCGPKGNKDLNFFCQFPAIRSRLLMGAATWKYQPDGFLYYRISGWRDYGKPIDSGPFVDWKPYFLPGPDGDGELICPGPNGALSTLQFENIRDGIEDYEYYWVLQDLISRAREAGLDVQDEVPLLEVPPDWLESITVYSEDPNRLRAERKRIAEAIVALKERLILKGIKERR